MMECGVGVIKPPKDAEERHQNMLNKVMILCIFYNKIL